MVGTEVRAAVGSRLSVCPCTQPGVSGGWPAGGRGRGHRGRARGRSGSTGHARWAAGSGQAGAASHRSRRTGGRAHSLRAARRWLLWARRGLLLCSLRLFWEAAASSPTLPTLPVTALSCRPGLLVPADVPGEQEGSSSSTGPGRPPGPAHGTRQPEGSPTPASSSRSKLHICRRVCCSHGDLRQASEPLGRGPRSLLCQYPPSMGRQMWSGPQLLRTLEFPDLPMSCHTGPRTIKTSWGRQGLSSVLVTSWPALALNSSRGVHGS